MLCVTDASNSSENGYCSSLLGCPVSKPIAPRAERTTRPPRPNPEVPDVYRAGREEGPFPSHLVASSSEVFAPSLVESEENPAEGAPSCPDKCKKVLAAQ